MSTIYFVALSVTTTEVAAVALSMIHEDEHRFRLVIANMKMPDMDRPSFLDVLLKKKIPIICKFFIIKHPYLVLNVLRISTYMN